MLPRTIPLWMALMMVGCSSTPTIIRMGTGGEGEALLHISRTAEFQPVPVKPEEFRHALRHLARQVPLAGSARELADQTFQITPDSGNYLYLTQDKKMVPAGPGAPWEGTLTQEDLETAERYRVWCQQVHGSYGDCLSGALVEGRYLDMRGRYLWAMAMSKSPVLDELRKALGDMVEFRALFNAALWTGASMLMICALNPVVPGLVAVMGVGLVLYVGADTLANLVTGWLQLMTEVKYATTFEEIHAAGERFGQVIGRDAARVFAMLVMAAIGRTAQEFAATLPTLPGSAQVAIQAEAQVGSSLSALVAAEEIAVTAEGVSVVLPPNAVAMAARTRGSKGPCIETHHIATICNDTSTLRGGPWTPRFRELFAKAGMKLNDPANRMPLEGHRGPHPERYHRSVYRRLYDATADCRGISDCRARLTRALEKLAEEIATEGSELNRLVTGAGPQ
jgi:hypothetical protein